LEQLNTSGYAIHTTLDPKAMATRRWRWTALFRLSNHMSQPESAAQG
jgi:hypothetical protein